MLTVSSVLRSGGDFSEAHVEALRDGVKRNLRLSHRFVCLTDASPDCETIPLSRNWPGWWSKICLFERGLFDGPVFYMDLDTVVCGPIDDLVSGHRFTALRDFYRPTLIGSGIMAWNCDLSQIFERFDANADCFITTYRTRERWGDQGFIRDNAPVEPSCFQAKFPGRIVSYKRDCRSGIPDKASIICFHGKPRPWNTDLWSVNGPAAMAVCERISDR